MAHPPPHQPPRPLQPPLHPTPPLTLVLSTLEICHQRLVNQANEFNISDQILSRNLRRRATELQDLTSLINRDYQDHLAANL